jgi:hypothetical protein
MEEKRFFLLFPLLKDITLSLACRGVGARPGVGGGERESRSGRDAIINEKLHNVKLDNFQ